MSTSIPQLVEVDPQRISFNPAHLRKHRGAAYLQLTNSLNKVGMVQIPTVRVISANSYESIDGDGRVLHAQETHQPRMWVLSLGMIDDRTALMMYQASNTTRSYNFLEECRGLASLHRQGVPVKALAEKFSKHPADMGKMVALGKLPEDLTTMILDDMAECEEPEHRWSKQVLFTLLLLRQVLPPQQPPPNTREDEEPEERYDYREVRTAIEKVRQGTLKQALDMVEYVATRRETLFHERFDRELQCQLTTAIDQARQTLQQAHEQEMQQTEQTIAEHYHEQMQQLHAQVTNLEEHYQASLREIAKRDDPAEIAKRAHELELEMQFTQAERQRLEALQRRVREEAQAHDAKARAQEQERQQAMQEMQEAVKHDLTVARAMLQTEMDQKLATEDKKLKSFYERKDRERQLKAENTFRQSIAYGTELLTQIQQWLLHIISPEMRKGLTWLSESELVALVAQLRAVRETMEKVEPKILYGEETVATEATVASDNGNLERSTFDGQHIYQR